MTQDWPGPDFQLEATEGLFVSRNPAGEVVAFGYRSRGRTLEVDVAGRTARELTRQDYDEEVEFEEWLEGWRDDARAAAAPYEARLACSFCGKRNTEVKKLIAGPTTYICNECVELCAEILADEHPA